MVCKYVRAILSDRHEGGDIGWHGGRGVGRMKGKIIGWEVEGRTGRSSVGIALEGG